jgi:hypothetical protein
MVRSLRWTSTVAFLLICLPCVQAIADKPAVIAKPSAGGPALCYEAWILEMTPREADRVLGARAPVARRPVRRLRPCAGRWLRDRALRKQGMRVRSHVRGCASAASPGVIAEESVYTYIQDYEVEVGMSGAYIADPIVGTLPWGVRIALHADEPGHLRLDGAIASLIRPVPDFTTRLAQGLGPVTIQLPEMRFVAIRSKLEARPGDWVLVGSRMHFTRKDGTNPTRRYVLLRVKQQPATLAPAK